MKGAKGVLINITGGADMTLFEVDEAANRIREEVDQNANIIFGSAFNENLQGKIRVSVVATGIEEFIKQKPENTLSKSLDAQKTNNDAAINQNINSKSAYVVNNDKFLEFARKNIPESYPSKSTLNNENRQDETITSEQNRIENERDSFFIAAKPEEPKKINPTNSLGGNYHDKEFEEESPEKRKSFGLFGRMASSVGFKSAADSYKAKGEFTTGERDSYDEEKELVTEDIIDIPAFERRKK
jgi:cell division protein FtsZ